MTSTSSSSSTSPLSSLLSLPQSLLSSSITKSQEAYNFLHWLILPPPPPSSSSNSPSSSSLSSSDHSHSTLLNRIITSGILPDSFLRVGIRYQLRDRLQEGNKMNIEENITHKLSFIKQLRTLPIALATKKANSQHYEVPAEFYLLVLGEKLKYSCCLFEKEVVDKYYKNSIIPLSTSLPTPSSLLLNGEITMLKLYCQRAELQDGQRVLDLGCGWGSFSLYTAPFYPNSTFIAVSNSNTQREFIMLEAKKRGINNLLVITRNVVKLKFHDIVEEEKKWRERKEKEKEKGNKKGKGEEKESDDNYSTPSTSHATDDDNDNGFITDADIDYSYAHRSSLFDRVISIEMFEHMKNYEELLRKVSTFVKPKYYPQKFQQNNTSNKKKGNTNENDSETKSSSSSLESNDSGKLFVHIFVSKDYPYHFSDDHWMAAYFFSGGTMPCDDTLHYFQRNFTIANRWRVNGTHYGLTCALWLKKCDDNKERIVEIFTELYDGDKAKGVEMYRMWRIFFMSCEELFNFHKGEEWFIGHYLWENQRWD